LKNQFGSVQIKYKFCLVFLLCMGGCSAQVKDGIEISYYSTGILESVKSYQNGVLDGITREYYEGGTLKHAINYSNDQIDGMYHTYYPSGFLWTKEVYEDGIFVGRKKYNEEGEVINEEGFNEG